jgi:hypothetical protein
MIRERVGAALLRFYPEPIRVERGQEILGISLDAGAASLGAFGRECLSLVTGGLRQRAQANARVSDRRVLAASFRLGALLLTAIVVANRPLFITVNGWFNGTSNGLPHDVLYLLILPVALVGLDRLAGAIGIACLIVGQTALLGPTQALELVLPIGFMVMVLAPSHRRLKAHRLLCLLPVIGLSFIAQLTWPLHWIELASLLAISLAGLALLTVDARLAIASALIWSSLGLRLTLHGTTQTGLQTILLVAVTPLMLAAVYTHRRMTRRRLGPPPT